MFETLLVDFALLVALLIMFMIYVGPFILFFSSIIFVLTRKSIYISSKILIVIIILVITFLLFITLIKFIDKPSKDYSIMKQINDKSIIGLSKEEVENKLGKPGKIEKSQNIYLYDAGTLYREVTFINRYGLWVKTYYYALFVYFDENDIVESTSLKESLEFYVP